MSLMQEKSKIKKRSIKKNYTLLYMGQATTEPKI
jgi:hypothetical protein